MPIDLLSGIVTGMCHICTYLYILTLVLDMLEARNEAPSVDFSFSFFFFGMCYLRHLFTLLTGQVHVGTVAIEAYCNTYTYMYLP